MPLKLSWFIPAILAFIASTVLLLIPGRDLPSTNIHNFDKLVHAGLFFVLALLFMWPFGRANMTVSAKRSWLISITLYAIAYGIIIEFLQEYLVANRSYDEIDMVFDAIGSVLALVIGYKLFAKK